jgi:hypothetical protein
MWDGGRGWREGHGGRDGGRASERGGGTSLNERTSSRRGGDGRTSDVGGGAGWRGMGRMMRRRRSSDVDGPDERRGRPRPMPRGEWGGGKRHEPSWGEGTLVASSSSSLLIPESSTDVGVWVENPRHPTNGTMKKRVRVGWGEETPSGKHAFLFEGVRRLRGWGGGALLGGLNAQSVNVQGPGGGGGRRDRHICDEGVITSFFDFVTPRKGRWRFDHKGTLET